MIGQKFWMQGSSRYIQIDTPLHELLKCKLHGYGISGQTLVWIDSILCNRQQSVVVNGAKSQYPQWARVLSGVLQGTVLGPLLFS